MHTLHVYSTHWEAHVRSPVVTERALTDFEHVLLGMLVIYEPSSGYDLKKLFTATPAAVYQPSAGALYPALRRLQQRGLIRVEADMSPGRRARRLYYPTEAGQRVHLKWVVQPVRPDTVVHDIGLHMMRFVMMEGKVPRADVLAFLSSLADALAAFVKNMQAFVAAEGPNMPGVHPLLALRQGIEVQQASLTWARTALADLTQEPGRLRD
jgi:DNA-binding PadR family transcriptional regulator